MAGIDQVVEHGIIFLFDGTFSGILRPLPVSVAWKIKKAG